jgi:beta-glucosidase/6-phospho-beta-glucosidase/beta-galactosidase
MDEPFRWIVGIEDTNIGVPIRHSGRPLDEFLLTQHDRWFREDLDRAASLGIKAIRYGIPWYRVHTAPGRFEWDWVDQALDHASGLGLEVIADLVHYGTPTWLAGSFADPAYPEVVAEYAGAFADRYRTIVRHYTPLNEPTVTALFCGERGLWPPYLEGARGWMTIVLAVAAGVRASVAAIREADSEAVIVHVEASKPIGRWDDGLELEARTRAERVFLPTDLVLGRFGDDHPLASWIREVGATEAALDPFRGPGPSLDVIGVNYYPELSPRELLRHDGQTVELAVNGWTQGLVDVLLEFHDRYRLPVAVTETGIDGTDSRRREWLRASAIAVSDLRSAGIPVWGYTWWPLFDFVNWSYGAGDQVVEEFVVRMSENDVGAPYQPPAHDGDITSLLRPMGLWRLENDTTNVLQRIETGAAAEFRLIIAAEPLTESHPPITGGAPK